MAETAAGISSYGAAGPEPESDSALFHRRIEFHKARRQFNGFVNDSSSGFKLVTLNPTSGSAPVKGSGSGKKTDKKPELAEAGLDPELSFEISFRRIGAGLRNLGNTCFLNSVLQCLTYTAPLAAYLQSGKHQNSCRTAGFCALCAIQRHVSRALQSTGRILEPKDLVSNLRCISRSFRNARQEDAHEYMVNLLESMHKCCLPSGVPSESPSAYEKSLVHKIFGGRLRSQVKCMQCSYCSNKFDPFLDLSLEIPKADSLYKALSHFTAKEQLDGGAREYHCEQCRQKVKALKQLTIHKAPEVLAVHLKRFSSLAPGQKIDKRVTFEPTFDLKPFVTGPYDGDLKYTLYGVLVHYGWNTHSGHYSCFVRTSSGMWYSLDDNQVVQVNERKVLEQKAYMLFYVRDRKHLGPKTHANALQKENMAMNAAYSKLNLELKEKILNSSDEKKLNGSCSAAVSGKDAPVTPPPKETPSEKMSSKTNGGLAVDAKCESLMVPPPKAPLKEQSSMEINSSINGSTEVHISCSNTLSLVEEKITSVLSNCIGPQDSLHKKEASGSVSMSSSMDKPSESAEKPLSGDLCKIDSTISEMNAKTIPMGVNDEPSIKTSHMLSSPEESPGDGQVPVISCNGAEETTENGQRMDVESKLLSDLPAIKEPIKRGMTKEKRQDLKVKRRVFKYQAVTKSLSSNILLGGGLCLRKKKHKQKRQRSMLRKSPSMKDENDVPQKQCATEKSSPEAVETSTNAREKKAICVSDDQNQNLSIQNTIGDSTTSSNAIDNVFRERILLNGSAVPSEKQTVVKQYTVQGNGISQESERESRQTEVMSMLTGALEETTVGRWDDNGVSHSKKSQTKTEGTVQIGYIGDEWDAEYDRGKRKKLRGPAVSFDGPNLFQQVATQRSKSKKAKLNRSRDANQPFRIK